MVIYPFLLLTIYVRLCSTNEQSQRGAHLHASIHFLESIAWQFCMKLPMNQNSYLTSLGDIAQSFRQSYKNVTLNAASLVIGANKGSKTGAGDSTDPSFFTLMQHESFKNFNKIFVEPIPPIYRELQKNVDKFNDPRAHVINAAIVDHNHNLLEMYCWKLMPDGNTDMAAFAALNLKAHEWMAGTCSLSKDRLFSAYDFEFIKNLTENQQMTLIDKFTVNAMTIEGLLSRTFGPILYLQIDAEGFDATLLKGMPWGRRSFQPVLINFEFVLLSEAELAELQDIFNSFGYVKIGGDFQTFVFASMRCKDPSIQKYK